MSIEQYTFFIEGSASVPDQLTYISTDINLKTSLVGDFIPLKAP